MKKLVLLFSLLAIQQLAFGQGYDGAFGIRMGSEWGLTYKQRFLLRTTAEGLIQYNNPRNETTLTLLGMQHFPLIARNINVYAGGGLHKGFVGNQNGEAAPYKDPFGLTLIGGIELSIARFNVSWDFKPSINLVGGENVIYPHTGISVRYIVDKRRIGKTESEKNQKARQKARKKKRRQKDKAKRKGDNNDRKINWKFWENF